MMSDWEHKQGVNKGPVIAAISLTVLACLFSTLALFSSSWASFSIEQETYEDEIFGYTIAGFTFERNFGLLDHHYNMKSGDLESNEETSLEEMDSEDQGMKWNEGIDWSKWYAVGLISYYTIIAGLATAAGGLSLSLIGLKKRSDKSHSTGIILCSISGALLCTSWLGWIFFGGGFGDDAPVGIFNNHVNVDNFGPSHGFTFAIVGGILMSLVPLTLAWTQERPMGKLFSFSGFEEIEYREFRPTAGFNGMISAVIICMLFLSVIGHATSSAILAPDTESSEAEEGESTPEQELIQWFMLDPRGSYIGYEEVPFQETLDDEQAYTISIDEIFLLSYASQQNNQFAINVNCVDDAETQGDRNPNDQTDTVKVTITSNNGFEETKTIDCDDSSEFLEIADSSFERQDWLDYFAEYDEMIFHHESGIDEVMTYAPIASNFFPIEIEFYADTAGDTLGQNPDTALKVELESAGADITRIFPEFLFMATEDSLDHTHYNSSKS